MKSKIIVILSILIFALGIFSACDAYGHSSDSPADSSDSVSIVESDSGSDSDSASADDSESVKDSESVHEHAFAFDSWVTAPGLEATGVAKLKCDCGDEKNENVPALSDTAVWTLTKDVADPCVGGDAEYTSAKYGKVTAAVAAKHDLGDLVPAKAATCKEAGNVAYRQCKKCNKYFGEDGVELIKVDIDKTAHTPADPVQENVTPATCTTAGSYDEVVKCSVCGDVISTTPKTIAALGHKSAAAVQENVTSATCTTAGSYDEVVKCSVCGEEISRESKTIDALGHTPAAAVQENVKAATCYSAGSYDEVVKCSVCTAEISRESKTTAIVDHNFTDGKCSMCGLAVNYAGVHFYGGNDYTGNFSGLISFSEKGKAADGGFYVGSSYSDSEITFAWADYAAGKITLTVNYNYGSSFGSSDDDYYYGSGSSESSGEAKTAVFYGYLDKATGTIVVGAYDTEKITTKFAVLIPSDAVIESAAVSSVLGNAAIKAGSVVLNDDSLYSVFIKDGVVFFGVTFEDISGETVAASSLKSSSADGFTFVVKQGDDVVAAYGVKDGSLDALDSVFGSYTDGDDTLVLDGLGKATLGDKVGTYVVNGEVVEIKIIVDGKVTEYHEAALDGATYTINKPMVTVSFACGDGHDAKASESVNKNVDFDLSSFKLSDTDSELFKGWCLNDELLGDSYIFTVDVTLTAKWATMVTIDIVDEVNGNEIIIAGQGDNLLEVLKAHDTSHETKVFEKYVVYSEEDGDYVEFDSDLEIPSEITELDVKALYYADVNVTIHPGMDIADIDTTIIYNANIKNYLDENYAYPSCVDGYKFDGWYTDSKLTAELAGDKTANADIDVYGKWTWAGNVEFSLGAYTFVYDSTEGYWKSNNKGVNDVTALIEITVSEGIAEISFDYYCESEAESKWDYLTIWYGPDWKSVTAGGKACDWNWKTLSTTVTYIDGDSNQRIRITYQKDGSGAGGSDTAYIRNLKINGIEVFALAPLNPDAAGTYTAADGTVVAVGAGGGATVGEETVAYTTVSENVIGVNLAAGYREITLDKENNACTITIPKVSVTYNYSGHGTNATTDVVKYSTQTVMSETPTANGFTFRGWYKEDTFVTKVNAGSSFTADGNITFYAKWDKAITVTYKYEDDGANADETDTTLYANDTVTVKTVDFEFDDKVFAGWFTKNADGEFDTQVTSGTALTDDIVLYAKWVEKSPFAGTYTVVKLSSSGSVSLYNSATTKIVVDNFGNSDIGGYNGFSYGNKVSFAFANGSTTVLEITCVTSYSTTKYYAIYDAATGIIARANGTTDLNTSDLYIYIPFDESYASADFAAYGFKAGEYRKMLSFKDKTAENAARNIYTNANALYVSASFKDYDGDDIAVADIKNALNLFVYSGETLIDEFASNGSSFVTVIDELKGYYDKDGTDILFLNGAGIAKLGDKTGTYALQVDSENILDVYFNNKAEYVQVTLDKDGKTYESVVPTVMITYNYMGHGETATATSTKNVAYTVSTETPTADGFKFRGWYEDEELTAKAKSSYTLTADITLYAKWDAAVTLTFDYNGQGTAAVVVSDKYVGDYVSGIPTVGADVMFEGKVFAGWFLMNEDDSFGDEASTSVVLEGNTTYYAKWVFAPESLGTYKGWNLYGTKTSQTQSSFTKDVLTVNANGTYKYGSTSGTLTDAEAAITDGSMVLSGTYYYFNKELGLMWRKYNGGKDDGVGTDTDLGVDVSKVASIAYTGRNDVGSSYAAYLVITYKDNTTKTAFLYNSKMIAEATLEGASATDITGKDFIVKVGEAIVAKVVGKAVLENDGLAGTYTGDYGDIVVDGFGSLTVGGATADYTVNADETIKFVVANAMRIIALDGTAYTKVSDGYADTYTLPDDTTITLDGYGNAGGKTYVVNGSNITIYDGETSTNYGLDAANKKFLGKSVFAGYEFIKDAANSIKFEDGVDIKGRMICGYSSWYLDFTGVLDGNTLTITVTNQLGNIAYVGKTLVFTVSGNKLVLTSAAGINSNSCDVSVGYEYVCEGFSL